MPVTDALPRPPHRRLALLLAATAAVLAAVGLPSLAPSASTATSPPAGASQPQQAEGVLPGGTTAFDGRLPGVARLDPALLSALRRATRQAAADGVRLVVNSGWRSAARQRRLLREAIEEHGSAAAAARWVATPERSAHVRGDAVDVGPPEAAAWLERRGAAHELCRVYANEPWHFERRPDAPRVGCPALYADAAHAPGTS